MLTVEKKRIAAYVIKLVASVVNGVAPPENDNADWQGISRAYLIWLPMPQSHLKSNRMNTRRDFSMNSVCKR